MLGLPEFDGDLEGRDREHVAPLHPRSRRGAGSLTATLTSADERRNGTRSSTRPPIVLALDTAGSACSVAVAAGDRVLCIESAAIAHGQAEALLPMVEAAMRRTGLSAAALDFIAVTTGPGSFTGIRVGLAAAHGIALALDLPLVGVTAFDAVAASVSFERDDSECALLAALESRRADLYVQLFNRERIPLGPPAGVLPAALDAWISAIVGDALTLIAGDGAERAVSALAQRPRTRTVASLAPPVVGVLSAALGRWRQGARGEEAQPFYLRPPDVTLARQRSVPNGP